LRLQKARAAERPDSTTRRLEADCRPRREICSRTLTIHGRSRSKFSTRMARP